MFHGNRWAAAFVAALGEDAEAGFDCLRAIVPPIKAISGTLRGYSSAKRLEKILRECGFAGGHAAGKASGKANGFANGQAGGGFANGQALEYAIRFISLIIEKNHFGNIDVILRKIDELLDAQKGALTVTVESAVPLDSVFEEEFKRQIMERLGATEIKMKSVLTPDLLGGYCLRIGGFFIDASLRGQVEKMKADLTGGLKYGGL